MNRRINRIAGAVVLLAFGLALSACEDFDMDKLDVFHLNDKKKLPGERKDVFPGGVPGVTEGVPPQLVKGYQAPAETATALPGDDAAAKKAAVAEPQEEPKPKPKPARKPKPRVAKRAPARVTVKRAAQPAATQAPAQQTATGTPAPWPASSPQPQGTGTNAPWPSSTPQAAGANSPWPSTPR